MVVLSAAVIIAVVSVCISVLNLNDTARILARSASTADDPVATASDLGSRLGVRTTTHLDPDTRIITVTVAKSIRVWFLGSRIPSVVIRSASSILSEPQVVLGQ